MRPLRRVALSIACAVVSMVFAQSPALAQPPGAIPAGVIHNTSSTAGFFTSSISGNLNVQITDATSVRSPKGGPSTTTRTIRVNIQAFGGTFFDSGCYDLAPSDFSFSISAAALHATITDTTGTCGGPPGTFVTPFNLDVTWTGTGPITTQDNHSLFHCGSYALSTRLNSTINSASAVGTLSPIFPDQFTAPQGQLLRSDDERIRAEGVQPDGCQPFGAIAGGAGPPSAGHYRSTEIDAGIFIFDPTGLSVGIFVTNMTQISHPNDSPTTTTTEFDVRINGFGGGTFVFGCFILTPADFTSNGVQSATLNTTITTSTPTCQGPGPGSVPLPLTMNVVWSGAGPVATTHSEGQLSCLTYHLHGQGLTTTNLANVTATLTPLLASTLTSDQGSLVTRDNHVQVEGAKQPACHL
jgi:hypothetical protein